MAKASASEETQSKQTTAKTKTRVVKHPALNALFWIVIISSLVSFGVWYAQQATVDRLRADKEVLTKQANDAKEAQKKAEADAAAAQKEAAAASASSASTVPPVTKANIVAAIESKNYAALDGYMDANVEYAIAASGATGKVTKDKAIAQLSYLNAATEPWNFALSAATLAKYKEGSYKSYLSDDVIFGVSANKYFVSFRLNSAGKIDQLFMAGSTDLL